MKENKLADLSMDFPAENNKFLIIFLQNVLLLELC